MADTVQITNIHRGKGGREKYIYAQLRDANGELLISATLEYILGELHKHLPPIAASAKGEE